MCFKFYDVLRHAESNTSSNNCNFYVSNYQQVIDALGRTLQVTSDNTTDCQALEALRQSTCQEN